MIEVKRDQMLPEKEKTLVKTFLARVLALCALAVATESCEARFSTTDQSYGYASPRDDLPPLTPQVTGRGTLAIIDEICDSSVCAEQLRYESFVFVDFEVWFQLETPLGSLQPARDGFGDCDSSYDTAHLAVYDDQNRLLPWRVVSLDGGPCSFTAEQYR